MITFRQHIPGYVDGEPFTRTFQTQADLLADPWITGWRDDFDRIPFSHFAMSDNRLMAVFGENTKWWVLGYLSGDPVDLPPWVSPRVAAGDPTPPAVPR